MKPGVIVASKVFFLFIRIMVPQRRDKSTARRTGTKVAREKNILFSSFLETVVSRWNPPGEQVNIPVPVHNVKRRVFMLHRWIRKCMSGQSHNDCTYHPRCHLKPYCAIHSSSTCQRSPCQQQQNEKFESAELAVFTGKTIIYSIKKSPVHCLCFFCEFGWSRWS